MKRKGEMTFKEFWEMCQICGEREAISRFQTLDKKKYYLCEECSKGLKSASWWKRRTGRELLAIMVFAMAIIAIPIVWVIWIFVRPPPLPRRL